MARGNVTKHSTPEDITLPVIFIIMDICVAIGNAFILYVVIRNRKSIRLHQKNKASQVLTVNLCIADLYLAFTDIYYLLSMYLLSDLSAYLGVNKIPCIMTIASIITAHMVSGFTIVAIAVERYIYVVHALRYAKIMNGRRVALMISTVWLAAIFGTLPLYFWNTWDQCGGTCHSIHIVPRNYTLTATAGRLLLIIMSITILHCRIHCKALEIHERNQPLPAMKVLKTRSARVVLIIFTIYIVSWSPFLVTILCRMFDVQVPFFWFILAECLIMLNYLVNPFIYAFHNRLIENAILRTLNIFKKKYLASNNEDAVNHQGRELKKKETSDTPLSDAGSNTVSDSRGQCALSPVV